MSQTAAYQDAYRNHTRNTQTSLEASDKKLLSLTVIAASLLPLVAQAQEENPNIVVIMTDKRGMETLVVMAE